MNGTVGRIPLSWYQLGTVPLPNPSSPLVTLSSPLSRTWPMMILRLLLLSVPPVHGLIRGAATSRCGRCRAKASLVPARALDRSTSSSPVCRHRFRVLHRHISLLLLRPVTSTAPTPMAPMVLAVPRTRRRPGTRPPWQMFSTQ
jgi:hypothetical protein